MDVCSPKRRSLKQLQALAAAGAEAGGEAVQGSPAGKAPAAAGKAAAKVSHVPSWTNICFVLQHPMTAMTVCMHQTWGCWTSRQDKIAARGHQLGTPFMLQCMFTCLNRIHCCSAHSKRAVDSRQAIALRFHAAHTLNVHVRYHLTQKHA